MADIKAILFDLGGVIMDLDHASQTQYFAEKGVLNYASLFSAKNMDDFFKRQEVGDLSEAEFYEGFRQLTKIDLTDEVIREGWNKILTDFLPERFSYLEKLAEKYPLYLFSNTNSIHSREFEKRCLDQLDRPLSSYFRKLFYSQEVGLRKPDALAFRKVLELAGLEAKNTVFVDDNADNIAGAKSVGLQTVHLALPTTILDLKF